MESSTLDITCYLGADFSDGQYWFARNEKADNPSIKMFANMLLQSNSPVNVTDLKNHIFACLEEDQKQDYKFVNSDFDSHLILHVQKNKVDRRKDGAKIPKYKYPCLVIPDNAIFETGESNLDIILMPKLLKSVSTNSRW